MISLQEIADIVNDESSKVTSIKTLRTRIDADLRSSKKVYDAMQEILEEIDPSETVLRVAYEQFERRENGEIENGEMVVPSVSGTKKITVPGDYTLKHMKDALREAAGIQHIDNFIIL